MPKKVIRKVVVIQRNFLWGGEEGIRKISWVSWEKICKPKDQGGLGIKNIELFNDALLGKWRWNLFHYKNQLWGQILDSKYDGVEKLCVTEDQPNESIWWKNLRKVCGSRTTSRWFDNNIQWKVGNGKQIRFLDR
uniref:Ribonuclease H protein At1g65750 family n=1 Tax=Cajanus cajan TaxID=3821 RepID=A0A151TYV9_CAJCA|nr:Putative ribonuclease H protein At1g65750 family [Cajanus cajan]